MLAVQVAVILYSTSVVNAYGQDAARRAAFDGADALAIRNATDWFRSSIGGSIELESLAWRNSEGIVSLEVTVKPPSLLVGGTSALGHSTIERTFEAKIERTRFA